MSELSWGSSADRPSERRPLDAPYPDPIDSPFYRTTPGGTVEPPESDGWDGAPDVRPLIERVAKQLESDGWDTAADYPPVRARTVDELAADAETGLRHGWDGGAFNLLRTDRERAIEVADAVVRSEGRPGRASEILDMAEQEMRREGAVYEADALALRHATSLVGTGYLAPALDHLTRAIGSGRSEVRTGAVALGAEVIDSFDPSSGHSVNPRLIDRMIEGAWQADREALSARLEARRTHLTKERAQQHLQSGEGLLESRPDIARTSLESAFRTDPATAPGVIKAVGRWAEGHGYTPEFDGLVYGAIVAGDRAGHTIAVDGALVDYGRALAQSRAPESAYRYLRRGLESADPATAGRAGAVVADLIVRYEHSVNGAGQLDTIGHLVRSLPDSATTQRLRSMLPTREIPATEPKAAPARARTEVPQPQRETPAPRRDSPSAPAASQAYDGLFSRTFAQPGTPVPPATPTRPAPQAPLWAAGPPAAPVPTPVSGMPVGFMRNERGDVVHIQDDPTAMRDATQLRAAGWSAAEAQKMVGRPLGGAQEAPGAAALREMFAKAGTPLPPVTQPTISPQAVVALRYIESREGPPRPAAAPSPGRPAPGQSPAPGRPVLPPGPTPRAIQPRTGGFGGMAV